jgi:hypothetical protein
VVARKGLADGFKALAIFFIGYVVWGTIRNKNLGVMLSAPMMWLVALANFAFFFARGIRLAQKAEETDEEKMKIGE